MIQSSDALFTFHIIAFISADKKRSFELMPQKTNLFTWILFLALAIIWGSSFILMKKGLLVLDAYQVASIRMISAGILLLPFGIKNLQKIPRNKMFLVLLSGLLGSFFPAYLFCIAEVKIASSLAGFLNALTPVFTIVTGILFFQFRFPAKRLKGVAIAIIGMIILFLANGLPGIENLGYSSFVLLATICYALNVNMVSRHLNAVGSTNIASVAFMMLLIPSLLVLISTGFFRIPVSAPGYMLSVGSASILGIFGTAVASIIFYVLLKRSGTLFTSMVTYAIPFVALFWGFIAGENINGIQIFGLIIILSGVYITNRK